MTTMNHCTDRMVQKKCALVARFLLFLLLWLLVLLLLLLLSQLFGFLRGALPLLPPISPGFHAQHAT